MKAPPKSENDDAYKFYKRRFIGLINLEADEQRNHLTSWKSTARFDFSDDIKPLAIFDTPNEAFINLEVGLQLRIFYEHENRTGFWSSKGKITEFDDNEIHLALDKGIGAP